MYRGALRCSRALWRRAPWRRSIADRSQRGARSPRPHESNMHPIPVDLAPYATDNRSALITQEHAEGLETWSLGIRECVGGQPLRQDADILAAWGLLDC